MRFFYPEYCRIQSPEGTWVPTQTGLELLDMLGETRQIWGDSEYLGYLCARAYTKQAREADSVWREAHWPDIYPERALLAKSNNILDAPNTGAQVDPDTQFLGTAVALMENNQKLIKIAAHRDMSSCPPREKSEDEIRFLEWAREHVPDFII